MATLCQHCDACLQDIFEFETGVCTPCLVRIKREQNDHKYRIKAKEAAERSERGVSENASLTDGDKE